MGTILVIDDDELIREMIRDILSDAGYRVITAAKQSEGFDILNSETVEAVLLDIEMPEGSGIDIIPDILKINNDISVIIVTAHASLDTAITAIREGAYDYIKKPLNEDKLLSTLERALERYRLRHENSALITDLKKRVAELELFEEVATSISSTLNLDRLLEKIMKITKSTIGVEACSILLRDGEMGDLKFTLVLGEKADMLKDIRIKPGQGIAGWVLEKGIPTIINDVQSDPRFFKTPDEKTGFHTKSMIAAPLIDKHEIIGVIQVINKSNGEDFDERDKATLLTMSGQMAVALKNAQLVGDLDELYLGTVRSLSSAIDAKSPWTAGHSERVTKYALLIGKKMGLSSKELKDLEIAAILHDIGKIGTDEQILDKPGKLTKEEYDIVKRHPARGVEMLSHINQLTYLAPAVKHHHEHFDGTSYPDQLKGEAIPIFARIISAADTYDAMRADRPYRKGRSMDFIIDEFKRTSGTQFDPVIVESMLATF